ncbi:hypothetical protein [Mycolicibacterium chlorophenolicum]|uniref:hypothetical protein n=1 Tax=Mycolicibacterium chlorophenolicum TaxID=37916 RepID=UPI000AB028F1|nr:hypothetical protein [Mycolicibacterium chlorophenolicum]
MIKITGLRQIFAAANNGSRVAFEIAGKFPDHTLERRQETNRRWRKIIREKGAKARAADHFRPCQRTIADTA